MIDFAARAYNQSFNIDPVIRSLLDTDVYKLLMLQFVWKWYPRIPVTFSLINRSRNVRLADIIDEAELRDQLDHARSLRFTESETVWLAGNKLYGRRDLFEPDFIEFLRGFRLPEYRFETKGGQYELTFSGPWVDVTLWEIYALTIVNELRNRGRRSRDRGARTGLNRLSKYELDKLYAHAKTKLWAKLDRLRGAGGLRISDFGTRRRHSHLWQEWAILAAAEELGPAFTGTSNAFFAHKHGFEAIGTNAHELPMVLATLAQDDVGLKQSQYTVLDRWQQTYAGALLVMLPDTYGSTQFLRDAPDWAKKWTGIRIDSKDPFVAAEEAIAWWTDHGCDPRDKRILFSDGLDVGQILALHGRFRDRVRDGYGWGTLLTNDFRGCHPSGRDDLDPISLVCKITAANGRPAVKLSDNYLKASGPPDEIARYRAVFGTAGVENAPLVV
ncbi:nicotinate phosphoribosyltransferase (plasmid) [Skermanella mucosa]|uniref:nicotinate phosphoribosyltransferase n=1 Tax=Skermanella mucosa TaxID=1789672 RepID=UPI00192BCA2E|nr:nicotinate phosphoribosyltransferase [Skermanella mucosa]UEM25080.1 nicotinate phosphoribosyltransferase [Skermanella mucosa]